jgi:hypothetical protein
MEQKPEDKVEGQNRGRLIGGAILILLGVAFFVTQFIGDLGGSVILFAAGAIFLVAYFVTRTYGFLIPGCILFGLALGQAADEGGLFSVSGLSGIGLGIGFIAIFLIDWIYTRNVRWWPLIPGGIITISGLASANENLQVLLSRGWPLILVVIGLVILAGAFGLTGRRNS